MHVMYLTPNYRPTEDMKKEKLNVWLSTTLKEEVYKEAQSKGMNISDYVRYVLRSTVDGKSISISVNGRQIIADFEKNISDK